MQDKFLEEYIKTARSGFLWGEGVGLRSEVEGFIQPFVLFDFFQMQVGTKRSE